MTLDSFVEHLAHKGIHLEADRDRVRVRAAKGKLDPEDRAALSSRKQELLAYLNERAMLEPLPKIPRNADLPLSFAQQRLWFLSCLGGAGDAYSISALLRLDGVLDEAALRQAFREIVRRHEVLRTCIVQANGGARQRINPPLKHVLETERLLDDEASDAAVIEQAESFVSEPFDLATGPLFRARLWQRAPEAHVLAIAVHHIVFDGWSLKVLMRELSALYSEYSTGRISSLPDPSIQYADYAAWQRSALADKRTEHHASYWRNYLVGAPAQSTILPDRPRPPAPTSRGGAIRVTVPSTVADRIRALARSVRATPFMTLLATWTLLLSRMSGQDDVIVGSPVANRSRRELEPLLGLFANTIALRFDLSDITTLGSLLEQVRATTLAAYEHQDMPFEQVVDMVVPERQMHHHPLFQTVFVLQSAATRTLPKLADLILTPLPLTARSVKFDLMLEVTEGADGFAAVLEYSSDLYDHATAEAIASRWMQLLEAIVQPGALNSPLHTFVLTTSSECDRLIWEWGSNPRPYRRGHTLAEAFSEQVAKRPDAIAVVCGDTTLTYRQLDDRANRLAHHLLSTGSVGPDVLVGLAVQRSIDLIVTVLGVVKSGAAYMPLDPNDPMARLEFMVADDVPLVITTRTLAAKLPTRTAHLYLDADASVIAQCPTSTPVNDAAPTNLAYALYTSGSTGEPKGVLVEQRSVMRLVDNAGFADLGPDSVVLHLAPIGFDASTFEIWGPLLNGGRLIVMPPGMPSLEEIGTSIRYHGVNTLWLTAGLFRAMVDERLDDLAPLRQLLAGGDVLSPTHVARVLAAHPHLTVINGYGPTETTTFATCHAVPFGDTLAGGVPIGRPIGNTHAYVLDRHGELAPPGVAGELFIGGDGVAREYRGRADLSAERFLHDPFRPGQRLYRTGDLVRWRADGTLEFLGRVDAQVKIRGFRVELGEVETALLTHPQITAAAVVAHTDRNGSKHLAAYVVPRAGSDLSTQHMSGWLGDRLPTYLHPQFWHVLTELPLTANGKLDRAMLPPPEMSSANSAKVAPRTRIERILADIWAALLDRRPIGIHDNFFELGGDSILSLQIVARCRQAGLKLLPREIFKHQTIAELAPLVTSEEQSSDVIDQRSLTGVVAPSPIQKWFHTLRLREPHHFNQSVLLELAPQLDAPILCQALGALIEHHDMLRLRVTDYHSTPQQWIAPPDGIVPIEVAGPDAYSGYEAYADTLASAQASLDLENGPILRALLFPEVAGRTARLLLVIHHLAVDGVSWRILLEDLESACHAILLGRPIVLPRKTLAFPRWVDMLHAHAKSEAITRDLTYWRAMPATMGGEDLPFMAREGNLIQSAEKLQCILPRTLTSDLLQNCPRAYNTHVEDILLTALLLSYYQISGNAQLRIDLEGHGRNSFDPTLDLSRTVGWFTCLYPVDLTLPSNNLKDALVSVKEQLRRVPDNGLAYALHRWLMPNADETLPSGSGIVFNYLGQFDRTVTGTGLLQVSEEGSGPNQGPTNQRSCLIEILSLVFDGSLRVEWHYHSASHDREYVEAWADKYLKTLSDLIGHCCDSAHGGYTPSDFPSVALDFAELEQIQALAAASTWQDAT